MSDIQDIIGAIACEIDNGTVKPHELYRLADALNGVNEVYHIDIVRAAFNLKKEETNEP